MPIYEYDCRSCQEKFERLHRRADEEVRCANCGAAAVERLFSIFSARVALKRAPCEGSVPRCSESRCRTGSCNLARE